MKRVDCPSCSQSFLVEDAFDKARQLDGKTFFCPNGHRLNYSPDEDDLLDFVRDNIENYRLAQQLEDILEHERRSHAATKGQLTRLKKRLLEK